MDTPLTRMPNRGIGVDLMNPAVMSVELSDHYEVPDGSGHLSAGAGSPSAVLGDLVR